MLIDCHGVGHAVAFRENSKLIDLFIDPQSFEKIYPPSTILKVRILRKIKERGGYFIKLPNDNQGFLLSKRVYSQGDTLTVVAKNIHETSKLQRFSDKVKIETKYFIIEEGNGKISFSKKFTNIQLRDTLEKVIKQKLLEYGNTKSIIVRSSIEDKIDVEWDRLLDFLLSCFETQKSKHGAEKDVILRFLSKEKAISFYGFEAGLKIIENHGIFDLCGVWDQIDKLQNKKVFFGNSSYIMIEETSAICSIDVNTGSNLTIDPYQVNIDACEPIADNIRLRAIGGKIVIDFLPCSSDKQKKILQKIEQAFRLETRQYKVFGWTKGNNFEIEISRDRVPLNLVLEC